MVVAKKQQGGLSIRKILWREYSHYGGIEVLNQLGTGYSSCWLLSDDC